jgi:riboflavin biosynthesis pyrimidine reductase
MIDRPYLILNVGMTADVKTDTIALRPERPAQVEWLYEPGDQVLLMGERRVDLKGAWQCLKEQGNHRLVVEGGGTLNEELLKTARKEGFDGNRFNWTG